MPRIRSGAPIRRHSLESGTFERRWYRPVSSRDRRKLEVAAEIHDRRTKRPGKHGGAVGGVRGLRLLSYLLGLQLASPIGELYPAIATMAARLGWSIDTVSRKLATLREAGLLEWWRRMKPNRDADAEWQWQQDSNAYRILVPAWIRAALPHGMLPPAVESEDAEHSRAAAAAEVAAHVATLGPVERVAFTAPVAETPLDAALKRFAAVFEQRDSGRSHDSGIREQSPPVYLSPGGCGAGLPAGNMVHGDPPPAGSRAAGEACGTGGEGQPPPGAPRTG